MPHSRNFTEHLLRGSMLTAGCQREISIAATDILCLERLRKVRLLLPSISARCYRGLDRCAIIKSRLLVGFCVPGCGITSLANRADLQRRLATDVNRAVISFELPLPFSILNFLFLLGQALNSDVFPASLPSRPLPVHRYFHLGACEKL